MKFRRTVQMARAKGSLRSEQLSKFYDGLGIPLDHRNALSDAVSFARIATKALA